jgi:hypothetical protein
MPVIIKGKQLLSVLFVLVTMLVLTFTSMSVSYAASEEVTPEMKIRSEQLLTSNKLDLSQECLQEIRNEDPPDNVPCTSSFSKKIEHIISKHCEVRGRPKNTPLYTYDTDLYGPNNGGACYVCCR